MRVANKRSIIHGPTVLHGKVLCKRERLGRQAQDLQHHEGVVQLGFQMTDVRRRKGMALASSGGRLSGGDMAVFPSHACCPPLRRLRLTMGGPHTLHKVGEDGEC